MEADDDTVGDATLVVSDEVGRGRPGPGRCRAPVWGLDSHEETLARIVEVNEPTFFSWHWAANSEGIEPSPGDQTLVEFRLEELGEVTRVTVNESGFETLTEPPENRMVTLEGNTSGWTRVLERLGSLEI